MRTAALVVALLALGAGSAEAKPVRKKPARPLAAVLDARSCTRYAQRPAPGDDGLVLTLENRCAFPVRCTLHYETSCGKRGEATVHDESVDLEPAASEDFAATLACGSEPWHVGNATWRCQPKTSAHDTASR
jgi:hypothetical protein